MPVCEVSPFVLDAAKVGSAAERGLCVCVARTTARDKGVLESGFGVAFSRLLLLLPSTSAFVYLPFLSNPYLV